VQHSRAWRPAGAGWRRVGSALVRLAAGGVGWWPGAAWAAEPTSAPGDCPRWTWCTPRRSLWSHWDAVRVDGAWHRVFWVARWPALELAAGWWDRLLLTTAGPRTLAVVLEPVPARVSRRRINAESVSV